MDFPFLGTSHRPHLTKPAAVAFGLVIGALFGFIFYVSLKQSAPLQSLVTIRSGLKQSTQQVQELVPSVDQVFVERAFDSALKTTLPSKTRIILIPHHLVAAREIASILSSVQTPKRILLLAPDHLGVGRTDVTVGDGAISLKDVVIPSEEYISKAIIASTSQSRADQIAIRNELSMQALYPFIVRAFPKASVTPVLMKIGRDQSSRNSIATEVIRLLREDSDLLLISTVDFSHYQPTFVADFHDVLAEDIIQGVADLETDKVELDSPGVLAVTLRVARELGFGSVLMHAHTNSLRILESRLSQESTSHFIASFSPGTIQSQQKTTMLFLGDMIFDREVKNRMKRSKDLLYPFTKLMGIEERFFKGQDAVTVNLEGPITDVYRAPEKENDFAFDSKTAKLLERVGITIVSQANNHTLDQGREGSEDSQKVLEKNGILSVGDQVKHDASVSLKYFTTRGQTTALIAFNVVGVPFDREKASEVFTQASTATYRVVYIHWGNEYQAKPSPQQIELAHWLIDQGADVIIGSHPHWMQGIEIYKQKPIVYSLGNAIFDQDWSVETQYGLSVGLVLQTDTPELHLFPIRINKSEPILLTSEQRQARLDVLADISDESLREQIESGVVGIRK